MYHRIRYVFPSFLASKTELFCIDEVLPGGDLHDNKEARRIMGIASSFQMFCVCIGKILTCFTSIPSGVLYMISNVA